ncbi:MAG: hypothetical protein M1820_003378 [Bogoriella megaspora]|nr:MAG: hypothetical protein M1820_003378 [Bogoriella megaspora]
MKSTTIALLLTTLPLALTQGTTCNADTANDIYDLAGGDDFTSFSDDASYLTDDSFTDDSTFTKRAIMPRTPRASSYMKSAVARHLISRRRIAARAAGLEKRQSSDFTCDSDSSCYTDGVDDILICLNFDTGDFTDNYGDSGNVNTGVVTASDGTVLTEPGLALGTQGSNDFSSIARSASASATATATDDDSTSTTEGSDSSATVPAQTRNGSGTGQGTPEVTSTSGRSGSTGSPSTSSGNGQPTGPVAGGSGAGRKEVGVAAAAGALGLMAAML